MILKHGLKSKWGFTSRDGWDVAHWEGGDVAFLEGIPTWGRRRGQRVRHESGYRCLILRCEGKLGLVGYMGALQAVVEVPPQRRMRIVGGQDRRPALAVVQEAIQRRAVWGRGGAWELALEEGALKSRSDGLELALQLRNAVGLLAIHVYGTDDGIDGIEAVRQFADAGGQFI